MTRILIAHHSDLTRIGLRQILQERKHLQNIAMASSVPELLRGAVQVQPHLVIFNDRLDPEADVLQIVEQVRQKLPRVPQIVCGTLKDGLLIRDLFACGVKGYLYESDELRESVLHAINYVLRNRPYLSPTANAEYLVAMQSPLRDWRLDQEARMILRLLAQGQHVGQIASEMQIPLRRVYWIREKLRYRFGALTNEHMICRAAAEGFIHL